MAGSALIDRKSWFLKELSDKEMKQGAAGANDSASWPWQQRVSGWINL